VVSFTPRSCYSQRKRRLNGPQSRSGRSDEKKNSQPLPGIELQSPNTVPSEILIGVKVDIYIGKDFTGCHQIHWKDFEQKKKKSENPTKDPDVRMEKCDRLKISSLNKL
jgi:hypothetical protein